MDLVPTPDQVVSAAGHLAQLLVGQDLADLRPTPRSLIDEGMLRRVHHYRALPDVPRAGDPVLLVAPLGVPSDCYDLRRGGSLVEHLVGTGRPTYLVDYGSVPFDDRNLGLEPWVEDVVPTAVRAVSRHARGRPVHLVGWSLGGTFALLAAAADLDLPVASVTVLGTPFDVGQVPLVAPPPPPVVPSIPAPLAPLGWGLRLVGGVPAPVRWVWGLPPVQGLVARPLELATRLDDGDFLAQQQAVERLGRRTVGYPGRTFGQVYHRFVRGQQIRAGAYDLDGRVVDLSAVTVPVLVVAGATDPVAPLSACREVVTLLTGSSDVRFEIVPGDHLGLLTGSEAPQGTWPVLDEWLAQGSDPGSDPTSAETPDETSAPDLGRSAARSAAARARRTRKRAAPSADAIGANPTRRHASSSSRALATARRRAGS